MSYILEALKKSEKARGGRKTRKMFEEPPEAPPLHSRTSGSSRRLLYLLAFILFVNVFVFAFRVGPWRSSAPRPYATPKESRPAAESQVPEAARRPPKPFLHAVSEHAEAAKSQRTEWDERAGKRPAAHRELSAMQKTSDTKPGGPPPAQGPKAARLTATVAPHNTPVARQAPLRVEVGGKKAPPSEASHSRQSRQSAVAMKAADLKALLEKQAERGEKFSKPASGRENLVDIRGVARPNTSNEPALGVPRLSQLPAQIRNTLPNLSVSMLVYSKQPADRFIYINGFKRHEGDVISRGLKVERITRDGAIFSYMGQRFYKSVFAE